jgi:outer membrane protein TolC
MKLTFETLALFPATVGLLWACGSAAVAQQNPPDAGSTVELAALYRAAIDADPRFRALQLQSDQTELRLRNIESDRLPSIVAEGQAQYQSDVPTAPVLVPGGQPLFSASKDTYDAHLRIDQRLMDKTIQPRLAAERAQLAEAQARIRTTLFGLRQEVNDAFFTAALLQERAGTLAATIADLEGRLREMNVRVQEGAALAADAGAIEATLLERRQDDAELRATRRAALARLSRLTARSIADTDRLGLPDLEAAVSRARGSVDDTRARPEYEQFARTRERLARQQDVAVAQDQPRVSAFARVGYGRPGLNFINDQFESYGLAGVQVQWKAWTWGTTDREHEALALQQQIVAADEAAFTRGLGRSTEADLAAIDRLTAALALDDRIISLREGIERSMQARFQERVVTAVEYLSRSAELLQARLARAGHRVELAQASAKFLTTLGLEVR